MVDSFFIRSFAGGELSPSMAARADVAKYTIALRQCRNFVVQRHGGVSNRSGTRYLGAAKTNDIETRLIKYVASVPGESVLIEMGELYLRFWFQGALVTLVPASVAAYNAGTAYIPGDIVSSGGALYYCRAAVTGTAPPNATYWYLQPSNILEVPTVFEDPLEAKVIQSGQVITFTHEDENPYDLVYESLTVWRMVKVVTAPKVGTPTGLALSAGAGVRTFAYKVSAAHPDTYEEGQASISIVAAGAADPTTAAPHTLSWTALLTPAGSGVASPEYYIYCDPHANGTFGFIGTATGTTSFKNPGFTPDFSQTPALARDLFEGATQFPSVCGYHQQRRWFCNFPGGADTVTGSRVGYPDNYGISSPLQDDDAITARIAGNNHHAVQWLLALKDPLLMTDGGEWRMLGASGVITPNSITFDQETYAGADPDVRPVIIGNSVVYLQARGSIVRDLRFDQQVEGLAGRDLTIFASHLFDGYTIVGMDYAQTPDSIVWACRSDGTLLGLTYLPDQDIWGWHRHDTDGLFKDVCIVPEPGEDAVYVLVRRVTASGAIVRNIEQLQPRTILNAVTDGFFVDAGLTYSGAPVSLVSGLGHLEGKVVAMVGDGVYLGTATVIGGAVSLGAGVLASVVHVGLPITADLETLDLDVAGTALRDKKKRVQGLNALIDASSRSFLSGPDVANTTRYSRPTSDPTGAIFSGQVELNWKSTFATQGRVFIRQDQPLPLTILGLLPQVEIGG